MPAAAGGRAIARSFHDSDEVVGLAGGAWLGIASLAACGGFSTLTCNVAGFGSGLNSLSRFPFAGWGRVGWDAFDGVDCLTPKGFTMARTRLAETGNPMPAESATHRGPRLRHVSLRPHGSREGRIRREARAFH